MCVILTLSTWVRKGMAQEIVIHNDLITESEKNLAIRMTADGEYRSHVKDIKDITNKQTEHITVIDAAQQKIFSSLTNVNSALKQGKVAIQIEQLVPKIFGNLLELIQLSAGNPTLLAIANEYTPIITGRVADIQQQVTNFILNGNNQDLLSPVERQKFLYNSYTDVNVIHNFTLVLLSKFKTYNFQKIINEINPQSYDIYKDKNLMNKILDQWKF